MEIETKYRGLAAATAMLVAGLALAGCGDDDNDSGSDGDPGYGAPETEETDGAAEGVELALADTTLGQVIADADGMTLYLFTPDEGGESTCYDECAEAWPPLTGEGDASVAEGLDESLVGSVERDDGSMQVTYNSHPLYYWANDVAPGDVTGQGVNDVWYVLDAEGNAVTEMP
ncbi:hypothetical protein L0U85_05725 [Glycomyces sp. L485]|uniref:COG4315 family predicted lipoprotein n=1 Tax=Glycomyces sp. L485 TaxID=2909235 RepID=UPI001F4A8BDB|nr:hypothetical protein [Glycomyces sp. L485]MCH7230357.1 hypothetical protein [Glycomyces sp. L485]